MIYDKLDIVLEFPHGSSKFGNGRSFRSKSFVKLCRNAKRRIMNKHFFEVTSDPL